ncbi:MAG: methyltransferase [Deltaproteobacteria bacterium]|nr:methyltransferase [Deltaproteobacteria bacterium]
MLFKPFDHPNSILETYNPRKSGPDWIQPTQGYRFSVDSIHLASFAPTELVGQAADLGAGVGVVGLEALTRGRLQGLKTLYLVEVQESFRPFLFQNVLLAQLWLQNKAPELKIIISDWRALEPTDFGGQLDYLISNPPYFTKNSGKISSRKSPGSRHEIYGGIAELLQSSTKLLKPYGTLCLSWPQRRLAELKELFLKNSYVITNCYSPPGYKHGILFINAQLVP